MKRFPFITIYGLLIIFYSSEAFPSPRTIPLSVITPLERGKVIYLNKENQCPRSHLTYSIQCAEREGKLVYIFRQKGEGDYNKYHNIIWEVNGEAFIKDGLLLPLTDTRTIKDHQGNLIVRYTKKYDYKRKTVEFVTYNNEGAITVRKRFRLKGYTVDDTTLTGFLRTFLQKKQKKKPLSFYLLTNKPKMYRVTAKLVGTEYIYLSGKEVKALKIKLTPSMGIISPLTNIFVPPTYLWYSYHSPYIWLKYEGLESGIGSPCVITYVCQSWQNRKDIVSKKILSPEGMPSNR